MVVAGCFCINHYTDFDKFIYDFLQMSVERSCTQVYEWLKHLNSSCGNVESDKQYCRLTTIKNENIIEVVFVVILKNQCHHP